MRAVVQRVSRARVSVEGDEVGSIDRGLLVLLGVGRDDSRADAVAVGSKIAGLRVFPDSDGKMNLDLGDVGGAVLLVSQFTLLADARRGRRPSFVSAASPDRATPLIEAVGETIEQQGIAVETGSFGAHMEVELVNDGPVTIVLDSADGAIV